MCGAGGGLRGHLGGTHEINGPEAAVADLPQVPEKFLGIFFKKKFGHFGILQAAGTSVGGHGGGWRGGGGREKTHRFCGAELRSAP